MDNDATAKRCLENFTKKVVRKRPSPLIREPPKSPPAKVVLPLQSKRLAAQTLLHVSASKRGEILIIQHQDLVKGLSTPSASLKKAYEALYEARPNASNIEALETLFQDTGKESRRKQQKHKPSS